MALRGVTSQPHLLCVSEAPLAFISTPGCTVKILMDTVSPANCPTPEEVPEVHAISKDPLHYSIVSATAVQKIRGLESMIAIDPGKNKVFTAGETAPWGKWLLLKQEGLSSEPENPCENSRMVIRICNPSIGCVCTCMRTHACE